MKLLFKIAIFALLVETITSPLRAITFMLCAVVTFILFFIFMNVILRKYSGKLKLEYILISALIGGSLIQVPMRIMSFNSTLISLPDFLFHLLGIVMGYLFYKASKLWRIFILAFSLISCIFIHFKGGDLWLHKLNFGTFTGKINVAATPDFQFTNEQGNCLSLNDFAGKYVVTDFWFTGCGVCFRKFPQVQYLYDEYKENPAIAVISINAKLKDEAGNLAFETIAKKGYSFPVYRLDMDNPILKEMKIDGYPTVLIFDKGGNIIFRGSIENASNYIKKIEAAAGY